MDCNGKVEESSHGLALQQIDEEAEEEPEDQNPEEDVVGDLPGL